MKFKPGKSGNPAGRPKGSRNKLTKRFMDDLYDHWRRNGKDLLDRVYSQSPAVYLKVVAALLSKNIEDEELPKQKSHEEYEVVRHKFLNELAEYAKKKHGGSRG